MKEDIDCIVYLKRKNSFELPVTYESVLRITIMQKAMQCMAYMKTGSSYYFFPPKFLEKPILIAFPKSASNFRVPLSAFFTLMFS